MITKFRVFNKSFGEWLDSQELVFSNGKWFRDWRRFEDGFPLNMRDCVVMQSTGLKDKNGVEIFEGDIVHVLDSEQINKIDENGAYVAAYFEELEEIDIVEFDDGRFKLRDTEFNVSICRTVEDFKVIGNIYENPELLEAE